MKLLASKFNEKKFFLRSQLYARAYVRIWTLRPCLRCSVFRVKKRPLESSNEVQQLHVFEFLTEPHQGG